MFEKRRPGQRHARQNGCQRTNEYGKHRDRKERSDAYAERTSGRSLLAINFTILPQGVPHQEDQDANP